MEKEIDLAPLFDLAAALEKEADAYGSLPAGAAHAKRDAARRIREYLVDYMPVGQAEATKFVEHGRVLTHEED